MSFKLLGTMRVANNSGPRAATMNTSTDVYIECASEYTIYAMMKNKRGKVKAKTTSLSPYFLEMVNLFDSTRHQMHKRKALVNRFAHAGNGLQDRIQLDS